MPETSKTERATEVGSRSTDREPPSAGSDGGVQWRPSSVASLLTPRPVHALAAGLMVQVGFLVAYARHLWFFGDDWEFLLKRSITSDPAKALLASHNGHWSTLPVLAYRVLFHFYGLGSYLPYAMMPIGAHVGICLLLYLLLRRVGTSPWSAVSATLMAAFLAGGAGAIDVLWDFQVGFLGSCFFGLLAMALLGLPGRRAVVMPAASLLLAVMCSGQGLVMTAWVCLLALFRYGLTRAVAIGAGPALAYVVWFAAYGHDGATSSAPNDLTLVPSQIVAGVGGLWSAIFSLEGAGVGVLISLVAAAVASRRSPAQSAFATSGLIALVVMFLLVGVTRANVGNSTGVPERYLYFGVILCAPAIACGFDLFARVAREQRWTHIVGAAVVVVVMLAFGLARTNEFAAAQETLVTERIGVLRAGLALSRDPGTTLLSTVPDPVYSPQATLSALSGFAQAIPRRPITDSARIAAQTGLQTAARPEPSALPPVERVAWVGVPGLHPAWRPLRGCVTKTIGAGGRIELRTGPSGGQVLIRTVGPRLRVQLADADVVPLRAMPVSGGEAYVGVAIPNISAHVFVSPGRTTVCPATAASSVH